jgi:excinuclease UvrABC ATPase subunit
LTALRCATIWRSVWPNRLKPRWSFPAAPPWSPIWTMKAEELLFSANFACPICGYSMRELEPRLFSFNNPAGACPTCDGLGVQQYFDPTA